MRGGEGAPSILPGAGCRRETTAPPRPTCSALELLQASTQARFGAVQATAREQAEAVGEADLRRLKRQFSSLKNTFLHYEVKNEFIAGGRGW